MDKGQGGARGHVNSNGTVALVAGKLNSTLRCFKFPKGLFPVRCVGGNQMFPLSGSHLSHKENGEEGRALG